MNKKYEIDWPKIFDELETTELSLGAIARSHQISVAKLRYHGTKHGYLPRKKTRQKSAATISAIDEARMQEIEVATHLKHLILLQLRAFERRMKHLSDEEMPTEQDARLTASLVRSLEKVSAIENAQLKQKGETVSNDTFDELQKDLLARLSRLK